MSSATYGNDGSLVTETNALNGVTFYARGTNASGQTVLTNTGPDGGVRIETLYQDASLLSVTGSAVHPVQYLYGVDGDGVFTTQIKVTETGGTNEWVKSSTNFCEPYTPTIAPELPTIIERWRRLASQARHQMVAPNWVVRWR